MRNSRRSPSRHVFIYAERNAISGSFKAVAAKAERVTARNDPCAVVNSIASIRIFAASPGFVANLLHHSFATAAAVAHGSFGNVGRAEGAGVQPLILEDRP